MVEEHQPELFDWQGALAPYAQPGGRLATNATTFNRELILVEKQNDGKPFALHTDNAGKLAYYKALRSPWLCFALGFGVLGAAMPSAVFGAAALLSLAPCAAYQAEINRLARDARVEEG